MKLTCDTGDMWVHITRRADGAGLLRCLRDDGSCAWQKQSERNAAHFALHDLTHFAVETTLGYENGFFGLVKQGWEMEAVTGKGARGRLPPEALVVEAIVGLFDAERACGAIWTGDEFNQFARLRAEEGAPLRLLTNDEIKRISACRSELFERWRALANGERLELEFAGASRVG
jgi:hypothetical protein